MQKTIGGVPKEPTGLLLGDYQAEFSLLDIPPFDLSRIDVTLKVFILREEHTTHLQCQGQEW